MAQIIICPDCGEMMLAGDGLAHDCPVPEHPRNQMEEEKSDDR